MKRYIRSSSEYSMKEWLRDNCMHIEPRYYTKAQWRQLEEEFHQFLENVDRSKGVDRRFGQVRQLPKRPIQSASQSLVNDAVKSRLRRCHQTLCQDAADYLDDPMIVARERWSDAYFHEVIDCINDVRAEVQSR